MQLKEHLIKLHFMCLQRQPPNGLRYLRWGIGAIRFGCRKNSTAGKMLGTPQNPQRQVHALLGNTVIHQNLWVSKVPRFFHCLLFERAQEC